ncbi:hypothetical protein GJ496_002243 [Pomphorhynchus laevis]|nr:hypothetical protein GJ496_002243 [Pomphorhynchus laevis]
MSLSESGIGNLSGLTTSNSTNSVSKVQHTSLPYRSTISPRSTSMTRGRMLSTASPVNTNYISNTGGFTTSLPLSLMTVDSSKSISGTSIRDNREKEKRELIELNDRFASYVERVRFLEIQNKQLRNEADTLKAKACGNGAKIKEMYETELQQARDVIASTGKSQLMLEAKAQKAEDDSKFYRERYDNLLYIHKDELEKLRMMAQEMSDNEATINLMNRRMRDLDDELQHYKSESQKLMQEVQRLSADLYDETSNRLQIQNEKQSLEEELNFLKQIHAQEIEDLQKLTRQDSSLDPTNFFRHELANAIKDIRDEYETLHQQKKGEMENWYRIKVNNAIQEVKTKRLNDHGLQKPRYEEFKALQEQVTGYRKENSSIKQKNNELENKIGELESVVYSERDSNQHAIKDRDGVIAELQMKLSEVLAEYEDLLSNNTNLNTEITVYRKLLEGSENKEGLKQIADDIETRARKEWTVQLTSKVDDNKTKTVTFQTEVPGEGIENGEVKKKTYGYIAKQNSDDDDDINQTVYNYYTESKLSDVGNDSSVNYNKITETASDNGITVANTAKVILAATNLHIEGSKDSSLDNEALSNMNLNKSSKTTLESSSTANEIHSIPLLDKIVSDETAVDNKILDIESKQNYDEQQTDTKNKTKDIVDKTNDQEKDTADTTNDQAKDTIDNKNIVEDKSTVSDKISGKAIIGTIENSLSSVYEYVSRELDHSKLELLLDISYNSRTCSLAFVLKRLKTIKHPIGSMFVRCTLMPDGLKQKSHAIQSCASPVWNTLFEFEAPSVSVCTQKTIYFVVKQVVSTFTGDKVTTICRAKLHLSDVNLELGETDYWLKLNPHIPGTHYSDSSESSTSDH